MGCMRRKRHEEYVRKTKYKEIMRIYDCRMKSYWIQLVLRPLSGNVGRDFKDFLQNFVQCITFLGYNGLNNKFSHFINIEKFNEYVHESLNSVKMI